MPRRARRWAVAVAAVLVVLVPLGAGAARAADDRSVTGGSLTWGVKQSFRSYVTGFIAHGEITTKGGATQAPDNGAFTFTRGSGSVLADGGASLAFAGSVRFRGHGGDLDVTLADPTITVDARGTGTLSVRHTLGGRTSTVRVATVTGATVRTTGDTATVRGAQTVLTDEGRAVFSMDGTREGSFYSAGDALDPASADATLAPVVTEPEPTDPEPTDPEPTDPPTSQPTDPEPTDPPTSQPTDPPTSTPTTPPTTRPTPSGRAGRLVWGVKSSFRSYVGGPIAQGRVTTSDHASLGPGGAYVFPQRTSSATPPSPTGTTTYRGTVGFDGHHGDLDMDLRNPRVVLTSPTAGRLVVDSRPTGSTSFSAVTVSSLDLTKGVRSTASGAVTYSGVPVTLSSAGTRLFAWDGAAMYPAGTAMDPVTFTIGTDSTVSGDGGSTTTTPRGSSGSAGPDHSAGGPATSGTATAPAASAPDATGAGSLTWGLRRSFRDYITGPIARGSISVSGGAGSSGGAFTFPQSGNAGSDGGAAYRGAVGFRGHGGILDLSFADPAVSVDSSSRGSLTAQVDGRRVTVATLNLGAAARSESAGATVWSNVPATLTAQGSSLFTYNGSSFYPAGSAMDPVSFTVGSAASTSSAASSSAPQTVASAQQTSSPSATSARPTRARGATVPGDACVATGSDLRWGFKESFRSYVSGTIANGDWSTRGGAGYTTPQFTWARGTGRFDERTRTGSVAFPGTVEFTGHEGKLNTTVSNPEVRIEGDRALVVLDVRGASMDAAMDGRDDTTSYPGTPFVEVDLSGADVETDDGRTTITVKDAPTALTPQGETAFSNYSAGTAFDPISFTLTARSSCLAPATADTSAADDDAPVAAAISGSGSGSDGLPMWAAWAGGAGLGAAAAAGAMLLVTRRRIAVTA